MLSLGIRLSCPYCGTLERMPVTAPLRLLAIDRYGSVSVVSSANAATHFTGATNCTNCHRPFGIRISSPDVTVSGLLGAKSVDEIDQYLRRAAIKYYPENGNKLYADEALPEKIRTTFIYVQEDADRKRNPAGILSGARSCLDVALKALGESTGGRRTRIQSLADKKIITQGIADWAQTLWEDGSDAVHDLDADIEKAIEHVDFLKLFFEVSFSLPARIARASHGAVDPAPDPEETA